MFSRSIQNDPSFLGHDDLTRRPDRRMWFRVRPEKMTFAVLRHPTMLVGQIIDISLGGLAFRYFSNIELDRKEYTVKIFESRGKFVISDLRCRKIYDILEPLPTGYPNFNITNRMKCCGLAFGNLTIDEMDKLIGFIEG